MIPMEKHNELPKITYRETGWKKSLAAYRIAIWHEHENDPETAKLDYKDALAKLGVNDIKTMKTTIGLIQTINDLMPMRDIYTMCYEIDRFANTGVPVLRLVRILAEHGIKDIAKAKGPFGDIRGIGPKYEKILEYARKYAQEHPEKIPGKRFKKLTVLIPESLSSRVKNFCVVNNMNLAELTNLALTHYMDTFR